MTLAELNLTPTQQTELEALNPEYVDAWLNEIPTTARSPTGWFLAGIRTGRLPGEGTEADRARAIRLAETWIKNAGHYEPDPQSLQAALFDQGGRLHPWADDTQLRARMTELYHAEKPRGQQADREQLERAATWNTSHNGPLPAAWAKAERLAGLTA